VQVECSQVHLTLYIDYMVLESQFPPQNRQLIVSISNSEQ